jgi:hypothetical protein
LLFSFILLGGAQRTDLRSTWQQKIDERNKQHCWIFDYTFYIDSRVKVEIWHKIFIGKWD